MNIPSSLMFGLRKKVMDYFLATYDVPWTFQIEYRPEICPLVNRDSLLAAEVQSGLKKKGCFWLSFHPISSLFHTYTHMISLFSMFFSLFVSKEEFLYPSLYTTSFLVHCQQKEAPSRPVLISFISTLVCLWITGGFVKMQILVQYILGGTRHCEFLANP